MSSAFCDMENAGGRTPVASAAVPTTKPQTPIKIKIMGTLSTTDMPENISSGNAVAQAVEAEAKPAGDGPAKVDPVEGEEASPPRAKADLLRQQERESFRAVDVETKLALRKKFERDLERANKREKRDSGGGDGGKTRPAPDRGGADTGASPDRKGKRRHSGKR